MKYYILCLVCILSGINIWAIVWGINTEQTRSLPSVNFKSRRGSSKKRGKLWFQLFQCEMLKVPLPLGTLVGMILWRGLSASALVGTWGCKALCGEAASEHRTAFSSIPGRPALGASIAGPAPAGQARHMSRQRPPSVPWRTKSPELRSRCSKEN